MGSLQHHVLKKICKTVDQQLSPELIKKLTQLSPELQEAVCHYVLRADEKRRARYKEVFNLHARIELIKTVAFDFTLWDCNAIALSSKGDRLILGFEDYSDGLTIFIVNLSENKVIHRASYPDSKLDKLTIKISVGDFFYAVQDGKSVNVFSFEDFKLLKKLDNVELLFFILATH